MDGQHPVVSSNARVTIGLYSEPLQALELALLCSKVDWERYINVLWVSFNPPISVLKIKMCAMNTIPGLW